MPIKSIRRVFLECQLPLVAALACITAEARVINANPSDYQALLSKLHPGDTLVLAPGFYSPLYLQNLRGRPSAWITITGADSPEGTRAAVIVGNPCCNTVEIVNSHYLAVKRLRIDSGNIDGVFGISANGGLNNLVHDKL